MYQNTRFCESLISCKNWDCEKCIRKSLIYHPNRQILDQWNYKLNVQPPIGYFLTDQYNEIILKCVKCDKNFKIKIKTTFNEELLCCICLKKKIYTKEHTKIECKKCNLFFDCIEKLESHKKTEKHMMEKEYICGIRNCKYKTKYNHHYKNHIISVHGDVKEKEKYLQYYCKFCDITNTNKKSHMKHITSNKHQKSVDDYVE